jgi:hypothetical protein
MLKRDAKICEAVLKELRDAEPHLTKAGIYDYDKVPQVVVRLAEYLIREYADVCEQLADAFQMDALQRKVKKGGKTGKVEPGIAAGKATGRQAGIDGNAADPG